MIEVSIEKGSAGEVLERLRTEWEALFADARVSPFLSWGWVAAWFESFGHGLDPMIMTARRERDLIGILAMVRCNKSVMGIRIHRLAMMGTGFGGADYLDVIARARDKPECLRAFIRFIEDQGYIDQIEFAELARDSETFAILKEVCRAPTSRYPRLTIMDSAVCPQLDLSNGWQDVLDQSRRKANFQRRHRALEGRSGFQFRSVTSADQAGDAFERFLELHDKRRAELGGSELSGHPRLVSFQRRAVPLLAQAGLIRFDEVWLEGRCLGSIYGLDDGRSFYYYNAGYDPEFRQMSIGLVLLGLSIRAAAGRGNSSYDLLRGDENYKFDWATSCRELVTLRLSRGTLPARIHDSTESVSAMLYAAARSGLPERIAGPLRGWHRARRRKQQLALQ